MLARPQPFEDHHLGRHDVGTEPARTLGRREAAVARARTIGADVVTTEMVIFEWLRTSRHPKFRALSKLIR